MPTPTTVTAPFRGAVTLLVAEGERVTKGQVLAVLEAMKLEAPLTAPRAGRVARLAEVDHCDVAGGAVVAVLV